MTRHSSTTTQTRLDTQIAHAVALIHDWLDTGRIAPMEALRNIAMLQQQGGDSVAVADACNQAVFAWNAAAMAHTREMMARRT